MMGIVGHLTEKEQLFGGKKRDGMTTILAMAIAAALTLATSNRHLFGETFDVSKEYPKYWRHAVAISQLDRQTAKAMGKTSAIAKSVVYQRQGTVNVLRNRESRKTMASPLLTLPKAAMQRLVKPVVLAGALPNSQTKPFLPRIW